MCMNNSIIFMVLKTLMIWVAVEVAVVFFASFNFVYFKFEIRGDDTKMF